MTQKFKLISFAAFNMLLFLSSQSIGQVPNTTSVVQNLGQLRQSDGTTASFVKYYTISSGKKCFFQSNKVSYVLESIDSTGVDSMYRVDMEFLNSNASPSVVGLNAGGTVNFYTDKANISGLNTYKNIAYNSLYNGVNLLCTNISKSPMYEYDINPLVANVANIQMKWTGATSISLTGNSLIVNTPMGVITYLQPVAKQTINGTTQNISANFSLSSQIVTFNVGAYDPNYPINITIQSDPIPAPTYSSSYGPDWVTYIEGNNNGWVTDVDIDNNNNIFVSGYSVDVVYPIVAGSFTNVMGNWDAFLIKFDTNRAVEWGTYFGGSGRDQGFHVDLNSTGYIYLCGTTQSSDIASPTGTGIAQTPVSPTYSTFTGNDIFIAKFNSLGKLGNFPNTFWSYFGTSGVEKVGEFAVDASNNVYIGGSSTGSMPYKSKVGAYNYNYTAGGTCAYLSKFASTGSALSLDWCTGVEGSLTIEDIVCGNLNSVYVLGSLVGASSAGVTVGAYTGNASGGSNSGGNFPLVDPSYSTIEYMQPKAGSGTLDYLVMRFGSAGQVLWATSFGGNANESLDPMPIGTIGNNKAGRITVDKNGVLYITGNTASSTSGVYTTGAFPPASYPNFPIKTLAGVGKHNDATYNGGSRDAFIARFTTNYQLDWSTYIGTNHNDDITGLSTNGANRIYMMANIYTPTSASPQAVPTGWPLKQWVGAFYQNTFAPGQMANNYYRGGAVTQFSLDGTLFYSTYYGALDFSVNNITNRTDDGQFYFGGAGQQYSVSLLKDIPGPYDYFYGNAPQGCGNGIIGQFTYICAGCQRLANPEIIEIGLNPERSVKPNPFRDNVIVSNPNHDKILNISWIDMAGKVLITNDLSIDDEDIVLNTEMLPIGMYILSIRTEMSVSTLKMIKQ